LKPPTSVYTCFNPSEKYESVGMMKFPIYGNIKTYSQPPIKYSYNIHCRLIHWSPKATLGIGDFSASITMTARLSLAPGDPIISSGSRAQGGRKGEDWGVHSDYG